MRRGAPLFSSTHFRALQLGFAFQPYSNCKVKVVKSEKSTWESLPPISDSREDICLSGTSRRWNTDGMWVVCCYVSGVTRPNSDGCSHAGALCKSLPR